MSRFLNPELLRLTPYTPGEQPQGGKFVKLNTNESPFPPSDGVIEALNQAEVKKLNLYSDPTLSPVVNALAERFGVFSIPTLVVMKNGEVVNKSSGARPKDQILALLN